jgi:hypothetical protein
MDTHEVALGRPDGRPRHLAVVRPGGKLDPGCNLDLAVDGKNLVLPQPRAVGAWRLAVVLGLLLGRQVGEIERSQVRVRVEAGGVNRADRAKRMAGVTEHVIRSARVADVVCGLAGDARDNAGAADERPETHKAQP